MSWPIPIPKWFWTWAAWRLGRGDFKPYGPANPAVRPAGAPKPIPAWAWERLKVLIGTSAPKPPAYPLLSQRGAFLRNPRGGIENFAEQAKLVKWAALNVGDYAPEEWATYRRYAAQYGIEDVPWARCYTPDDVRRLIAVAVAWGSKAVIPNVENEILTVLSPAVIRDLLAGFQGERAAIVLGWVQNGQGWGALADTLVILEVFTNENPLLTAPVCEQHAREEGLRLIGFCWGTYANQGGYAPQPSLYPLGSPNPQSYFTGDDIGIGNWLHWAA